jgi:hypothetical protein
VEPPRSEVKLNDAVAVFVLKWFGAAPLIGGGLLSPR